MTHPTTHDTPRHGWPDPDRLFIQANYSHLPWGDSGRSWGAWGCPGMGLVVGQRLAGIKAGATPETLQAAALAYRPLVWPTKGKGAVLPRLAFAAGFSSPTDVKQRWTRKGDGVRHIEIMTREAIDGQGTSRAKGFGWLQVDYDGDEVGDHWILAYAYDEFCIYCYDSVARGGLVQLDRKTLTGVALWGEKQRPYSVVAGYGLGV